MAQRQCPALEAPEGISPGDTCSVTAHQDMCLVSGFEARKTHLCLYSHSFAPSAIANESASL